LRVSNSFWHQKVNIKIFSKILQLSEISSLLIPLIIQVFIKLNKNIEALLYNLPKQKIMNNHDLFRYFGTLKPKIFRRRIKKNSEVFPVPIDLKKYNFQKKGEFFVFIINLCSLSDTKMNKKSLVNYQEQPQQTSQKINIFKKITFLTRNIFFIFCQKKSRKCCNSTFWPRDYRSEPIK